MRLLIFAGILAQAGYDFAKAKVRLNWGSPETPDVVLSDLIKAAELSLIRPEEFRKNAVKFGWELWEANPSAPAASEEATVTRSS